MENRIEPASKGMRLHIGLFGRRNAGKSSLLNALTRQEVSIVSEIAGTTTDPVEKPMELLPLGPVVFIDTAGIDDAGALGAKRMEKTEQCLDRVDLGLIVAAEAGWGEFEEKIREELTRRNVPVIAVFNKDDILNRSVAHSAFFSASGLKTVAVSALTKKDIPELRQAIIDTAPADFLNAQPLINDLVGPGEMAMLVVPIDKEAPRGRLILPQVQVLRDLLDAGAYAMVVREHELKGALARLAIPPKLVVTDSQAFAKVNADTPRDIPLTGFSILFSRFRGNLITQVMGALAIDRLKSGDRVLVAEACAHHPVEDDIGRVKIPRWIREYTGNALEFQTCQGHDFPSDLSGFKLAVLCGSCMQNRREVLNRIETCCAAGVPVTNYGLAIAHSLGILERALSPFPTVLDAFRKAKHGQAANPALA